MTHPSDEEIKAYEISSHIGKAFAKKRKISVVGYTLKDWILKKLKIGIIHTVIWGKKGGHNNTKVKITIEEL